MSKMFIVSEKTTEYDDQNYSLGSGSEPVEAYESEQQARTAADEKNREWRKSERSGDWEEPVSDLTKFEVTEVNVVSDETYASTVGRVRELREQAKKQGKIAFDEGAKKIFADNPKLKSFSWTQYTPYFNDGDSCEFGVNRDELSYVFDKKEYEYVGMYNLDKEGYTPEFKKAVTESHEFIGQFEEEDLEAIFGDHVQVKVTAKGAKASEYSHE